MDPLSEVLALLKPRSHVSGRFDVVRNQAIRFPAYDGIKCYAVIDGACWLSAEGVPDAILLEAGDCFLLPKGLSFTLATDLSQKPVDFDTFLATLRSGGGVLAESNSACYLAGGHFLLESNPADLLFGLLPPIVHLRTEPEKAAMRWSLDRMHEEVRNPQLGGSLVVQQLAYMMLVQALRTHLTVASPVGVGWLYALTDPNMKKAIACIHNDPSNLWTVSGLAERAGMSRSIFALQFKRTVGATPMEYLTRWRMLLAGDRLRNSADSVSMIAASLGYDSESAFGKAFKRVIGSSPRQYCRAVPVRGHSG